MCIRDRADTVSHLAGLTDCHAEHIRGAPAEANALDHQWVVIRDKMCIRDRYNGDYKTDYASKFTDIALTVEKQADEQFSLAPGYTYYFDLSAMGIPGTVNDALPDSTLHYVCLLYTSLYSSEIY